MEISIIGTSGRKNGNTDKLTPELFEKMVESASSIIEELCPQEDNITLISGGAAWADHVAVVLFLRNDKYKLKLYTPCAFDFDSVKFKDTGVVDWRSNPGGTLNYYHRAFSKSLKTNTLKDIAKSIKKGVIIDSESSSFHKRNTIVAKSDIIIAYTWGDDSPVDGGTFDTWKKIPKESVKRHVSLKTL